MSERTDTKLRETMFFFQNLVRESDKESPSEPEAFLFYLNAFLTASQSFNMSTRTSPTFTMTPLSFPTARPSCSHSCARVNAQLCCNYQHPCL
jgi:hypothetical protein